MHARAISSLCVTSRKADDDEDDAFAAHARDVCVEVLILTHRAVSFPYRARVHRLFPRADFLPGISRSSAARDGSIIRGRIGRLGEHRKNAQKGTDNTRAYVYTRNVRVRASRT